MFIKMPPLVALALVTTCLSIPLIAEAQHGHESGPFHSVRADAGWGLSDSDSSETWDVDSWIGGDVHRFWLKSEGQRVAGSLDSVEVLALASTAVSDFWDAQLGVRYDLEPGAKFSIAAGFEGLAPYFFDSEIYAFVSQDRNVSLRLHHENELLLTQRLIFEPTIEVILQGQDITDQHVEFGFSQGSLTFQLRYEISRGFAPFLEISREQVLGASRGATRRAGGDVQSFTSTAGVRLMF